MALANNNLLVLTPYYPSDENPFEAVFIEQQVLELKNDYEKIVVFRMLSLPVPLKKTFYSSVRENKSSYIRNSIKVVNFFYFDNKILNVILGGRLRSLSFQLQINYYLRGLYKYNFKNKLSQWILPTTYVFSFLNYKNSNVVSVIRGMDITILKEKFPSEFEAAIRYSNHVVSNGSYVEELVSCKTKTIYNIKDLTPFLNVEIKENFSNQAEIIIVHVGRFDDNKRQDLLIDLVSYLRKLGKNVHLNLVGDGALLEQVKKYAKEKNVFDFINFTGNIKHFEMADIFAKSDFYIHPSHREGIPNSLVEAMASGCVCVARNVGGIPDLIHDENGFLFNKDEELFNLFTSILSHKGLFEIRENARKHVCKIFDNEKNKHLLLNLLDK